MFFNQNAIDEITCRMDHAEQGRSFHWQEIQKNFTVGSEGFSHVGPIGTFSTKTDLVRTVGHYLLQIPFRWMGRSTQGFAASDRAARHIARRQGRQYDLDFLRHVLTLGWLRDRLTLEDETDPILIMGDGYANMAPVILASLPKSRVILINLTKTLAVDLVCLRRGLPDVDVALAVGAADFDAALGRVDLRVIALTADEAPLLARAPLSLGINIQSMMEMDPSVTAEYFDVMRRCSRSETAFYCCNNVKKRWNDGTIIRFDDYPWDDRDRILKDELCPWLAYRYGNRPPFYVRRGENQHRLVYLAKF